VELPPVIAAPVDCYPNIRLFDTFDDASAATAVRASLSTKAGAIRPTPWPEMVRGFAIHSAEWTPAIKVHFESAETQALNMAIDLQCLVASSPPIATHPFFRLLQSALHSTSEESTVSPD
jgi:hypothetical protein